MFLRPSRRALAARSLRAGVPEQPPDWGRTPGAKPRSSRKPATDDDDEPGDENSFRAIAAEFFQSTKADIADMMAAQATEIRTTKDLVNQLLTALNDLKTARGRSGSRDSTRSSQRPMSEHAREQRRAEKQPIVEVKPAIVVSTSEPIVSFKPSLSAVAMRDAQSANDPAGFTGHFDAIPTDLYRIGGYAFTMRDFLAAQAVIEVPRRELEEQGRWRARAFHAYATEAQKQAKARDVAAARDTSAVPRTSTEAPIRDIAPHMHVPRPTPTREDWGLAHRPSLPKSFYAAPPNHRDERQRAPSPFAEPVSAMRSTPVRLAPQEMQFTEAQYRNLYGPGVDPMDQRLLLALYTFENKHFSERLPSKVNGVKMEPPTYSGAGEIATLENFLIKFFKWQMVHGLTDSLGFSKALEVMGLCLKGSAERWYATECTIQAETGNEWTFESLIVGLRQRFVHATAKADAKAAYEALRLGPEGVMELDSELSRAAGYLVEMPSDYDRRLRLLSALPFAMTQRMIQDGYTAEKSTMQQLVTKAVDLEAAAKASAAARSRDTPRNSPMPREQDGEHKGGTPYRDRRDQSFAHGRFRDGPRNTDWNRQQEKPLPPTPVATSGGNKPFATPPARPGSTFTPRSDASRHVRVNAAAVAAADAETRPSQVSGDATEQSDEPGPTDTVRQDLDYAPDEPSSEQDEPAGNDEYDGLGYDEQDITGFDIEPDEWLSGEDDKDLYEHVAWTRMARVVDVENTVHAAGVVTKPAVVTVYRHASRPARAPDDQPERAAGLRQFFEGIVQLGNLSAHVLVDTGTDTDMVSAEYARDAKLHIFQLQRPVTLQMACIGSRSRINFGAKSDVGVGALVVKNRYFDVANIDKYDAILGLPFLWATAASLRFQGAGILEINGQSFDLLESDFAVRRKVSSRDQTNRAAAPTKHGSAAVPPVDPRAHTARMGRIQYVEDESTVVADYLSTTDEPCELRPVYESAQQLDLDGDVCKQCLPTDRTTQKLPFTSAGVHNLDGGILDGTPFSRLNQIRWFDKIPIVDFILNSSTNATTGLAPFETVYGYEPQTVSRLSILTPSDLAIRMDGETGAADPNATLPSTLLVQPCDLELRTATDAALEDTHREQWEKERREARESQDAHH